MKLFISNIFKRKGILCVFTILILFSSGCQVFQVFNLVNCKFNVAAVEDIIWADINLTHISSVKDLSIANLTKAARSLKNKDFGITCNVKLNVLNESSKTARLIGYDYELFLDEVSLVSGSSKDKEYVINPNSTGEIIIPVSVDLVKVFQSGSIDNIVNFACNLTNYGNGKESKVKIKFTPYINVGQNSVKLPMLILNKTFQ